MTGFSAATSILAASATAFESPCGGAASTVGGSLGFERAVFVFQRGDVGLHIGKPRFQIGVFAVQGEILVAQRCRLASGGGVELLQGCENLGFGRAVGVG